MELKKLREKILIFNKAYEEGSPLVEDYVYDFYKKKLEIMEKFENNKISDIIGSLSDSTSLESHLFPVLSLNHDFGIDGISKFIKKISKYCELFPLIAELKIDGVSVIIRYENGILQTIKTRGDGLQGENISHLKNFLNIPNTIRYKELLEIRCEAYIEKKILKNPRNAVAAMLLKKEIDPNLKYIKLAPHNLYSSMNLFDNYLELRTIFKSLCFDPIYPFKICYEEKDCKDFFNAIKDQRDSLKYEIDGIVFKINDKMLQNQLGSTAKAPKHSFAIKFANSFNLTTINKIQFQMSRTGVLTPVAYVEPTIINDRVISKATLNNLNDLYKKNYNIGDIVQIEIAGDVIPKITKIIEKKIETKIIMLNCPFCDSLLKEGYCDQNWKCKEQRIQKLMYFASKHAMNIKNIGEQQIKFFVEEQLLYYPQDFYELKNNINKIKTNPSWLAEKSLSKLLENIEKSRYTTLNRFYLSLGLPLIGKEKVKLLAETFNIKDFLEQTENELKFLGNNIAKYVYDYKEKEKAWITKTSEYLYINQKYAVFNLFS